MLVWLGLAVIATAPFWLTDVDLRVARLFFHEASSGSPISLRWPGGEAPIWRALYATGSAIAWVVVAFAMLVFLRPRLRDSQEIRRLAFIVLATVAIGPGLLVNALGKDFTGRPRPRHLVEFGGQFAYKAPWQLGTPGIGKSFPCGHCSVGFAVGAAGIAIAQSRPLWGGGILTFSLLLGGAIGIARIAAGAHFLSDVLWAALLSLGPGAIIARSRWRGRVSANPIRLPRWARISVPAILVAGVVTGLVLARPFHELIEVDAPLDSANRYVLSIGTGTPRIELDAALATPLRIRGEVQGFGLPNVEVHSDTAMHGDVWRYRLAVKGWTSEIEAPLVIIMNPSFASRIHIESDVTR